MNYKIRHVTLKPGEGIYTNIADAIKTVKELHTPAFPAYILAKYTETENLVSDVLSIYNSDNDGIVFSNDSSSITILDEVVVLDLKGLRSAWSSTSIITEILTTFPLGEYVITKKGR